MGRENYELRMKKQLRITNEEGESISPQEKIGKVLLIKTIL